MPANVAMSDVQPSDCTTVAAVCSASDRGIGGAIVFAVIVDPEIVALVLAVLFEFCVVVPSLVPSVVAEEVARVLVVERIVVLELVEADVIAVDVDAVCDTVVESVVPV